MQVRSDYMQHSARRVSDGMAVQLGCLEIRYIYTDELIIIITFVCIAPYKTCSSNSLRPSNM